MMKRDARDQAPEQKGDARPTYSPQLRTALVLVGTGTAGAYHSGVLHALGEAGVKVDLVAGRGIGVPGALFAAVGRDSELSEPGGIWRGPGSTRFYGWRTALRVAFWAAAAAAASLVVPPLALACALTIYGIGAVLGGIGLDAGSSVAIGYARVIEQLFDSGSLPTIVPRVVTLTLVVATGSLVVAGGKARAARRGRRHDRGSILWDAIGAPWASSDTLQAFRSGLWRLMRGATPLKEPDARDLSRRYAELLTENLGQPGFRELIVTVHDLDARRDFIFALLAEPFRREFFKKRDGEADRRAETFDLSGVSRDHVVDALSGALSLPVLTEPHFLTLHVEGFWRGETHRLTDRPEATVRLLREVAAAGAEQVIVVAPAVQLAAPHGLTARRADVRSRVGDYFSATEAATLRDAVKATGDLFNNLFVIQPVHSAIGPFDFSGTYDERSDRHQPLGELLDRGYEDAYRQFIEPVVGASGERLEAGATLQVASRRQRVHEEHV